MTAMTAHLLTAVLMHRTPLKQLGLRKMAIC